MVKGWCMDGGHFQCLGAGRSVARSVAITPHTFRSLSREECCYSRMEKGGNIGSFNIASHSLTPSLHPFFFARKKE